MGSESFFVVSVEGRVFAFLLEAVEHVAQAVQVTPFAQPTGIISGVINVRGAIVPVVRLRRLLGLPER